MRHQLQYCVIPTGASALLFPTRAFRGWADAEWRDLLLPRSGKLLRAKSRSVHAG